MASDGIASMVKLCTLSTSYGRRGGGTKCEDIHREEKLVATNGGCIRGLVTSSFQPSQKNILVRQNSHSNRVELYGIDGVYGVKHVAATTATT